MLRRTALLLSLFLLTGVLSAQTSKIYKDSWDLGFGINSVRFASDLDAEVLDFGAHSYVQYSINEKQAVRFRFDLNQFNGRELQPFATFKVKTTAFSLGTDYLFKFFPCEPVSPYFGAGFQILAFDVSGSSTKLLNKSYIGELGARIAVGAFINFLDPGDDWKLRLEFSNVTVSTDKFDGLRASNGGIFGGTLDSYIGFDIGLQYYMSTGEASTICEMHDGLAAAPKKDEPVTANIDYERIEDIIKKYAQSGAPGSPGAEVDYNRIEDIVKRNSESSKPFQLNSSSNNWVLIGINFDFASKKINPESYPILINAAQVLLSNPSLNVEIQGYTDNVGSPENNKKLSQTRADLVRQFLISKGVEAGRLTAVGYGASNPISDNKTDYGRSLNRRIEFRIVK